jgi:hypothetical protein
LLEIQEHFGLPSPALVEKDWYVMAIINNELLAWTEQLGDQAWADAREEFRNQHGRDCTPRKAWNSCSRHKAPTASKQSGNGSTRQMVRSFAREEE